MNKKYRIGDLFDIHPTKTYKLNNYELYATHGVTPVLSNSSFNNGIGGYCGLEPTEEGKIITFSDTTTGADTMFYQSKPFIGYSHVQGMYPYNYEVWNEKRYLYVISSIRKASGNRWNYAVKFNRALVLELMIDLPVIKHSDPNHEYTVDDIDWQYMEEKIKELEEERIKELEEERIKELDAYLKAANLDNYELTDEDKQILSICKSPELSPDSSLKANFKDFIMQYVFHKVELKRLKKSFDKKKDLSKELTSEFNLPLVNAKNGDNGIMYYGRSEDWESDTYCIDIVNDGAVSTGNVYAQPQRTGVLYNAYLIKPNKQIESESVLLYLAKCIEKITKEKFSYDKKATWERVKECKITLPITPDGEPDFDYMERYIKAIEKLTIADVVKYKDKVINTTKKIVNNPN